MKKSTNKSNLRHLQERYKDFLESNGIDIVELKRDRFIIGGPTFIRNGTSWYEVFQFKNIIKILEKEWDESMDDDNFKLIKVLYYKNIDTWMKAFGFNPSDVKSNPKKSYRK